MADLRSCIRLRIIAVSLACLDRSPNRCFAAFRQSWRGLNDRKYSLDERPLCSVFVTALFPFIPPANTEYRGTQQSHLRGGRGEGRPTRPALTKLASSGSTERWQSTTRAMTIASRLDSPNRAARHWRARIIAPVAGRRYGSAYVIAVSWIRRGVALLTRWGRGILLFGLRSSERWQSTTRALTFVGRLDSPSRAVMH